jgi:1,4-dihydroxy-2-naphthoate octaprenyltransferase
VLLALLSAPVVVPPLKLVMKAKGAELNPALGGTARVQLAYGVLFSVGLFLR